MQALYDHGLGSLDLAVGRLEPADVAGLGHHGAGGLHAVDDEELDGEQAGDVVAVLEGPALERDDVALARGDEELLDGHDGQAEEELSGGAVGVHVPHLEEDLRAPSVQVAVESAKVDFPLNRTR